MSTPAQAAAAMATRDRHTRILTNGVSVVSPMWYIATMGLPKGPNTITPDVQNWRKDILWNQGGETVSWNVTKKITAALHNSDTLRTRDFSEADLIDLATVRRYNVEQTWAISEGDIDSNKGDSKLQDLRALRRQDAMDAVQYRLRLIPWQADETGQNGGLTMFSPTNVAGSETYAGIAMDVSDATGADTFYYWRPTGYDYGASTIADNLLTILEGMLAQMKSSKDGASGGRAMQPDFAAFSNDSWAELVTYMESKLSINVMSESAPRNYSMFNTGFFNINIRGVTMFPDDDFGASNGYVDAVAAEEFLMGYSKYIRVDTTAPKGQFVRAMPTVKNDPRVAGELGVFKTGRFSMFFENPRYFQVAYT